MPPKKKAKASSSTATSGTRKSTRSKAVEPEAGTSKAGASKAGASKAGASKASASKAVESKAGDKGTKKRKKQEQESEDEDEEERGSSGGEGSVVLIKAPPKKKQTNGKTKQAKAGSSKSKPIPVPSSSGEDETEERPSKPSPKKSPVRTASKSKLEKNGTSPAKSKTAAVAEKKQPEKKKKQKEETFSEAALNGLFAEYEDPDIEGIIGPEGYERLCTDAGFEMDTIYPLALGFVVSTSKMAHISRAEFTASLTPLRISSVDALSSHLSKFVSSHLAEGDVGDPVWKSFYAFVGKVCREEGQKNVDWQTACAVWSLIFPSVDGQGGVEASKTARDFVKFANVGEKRIVPKGVGKDIWDQLVEFSETCKLVGDGLEGYSEDDSWPLLFDQYAEWVKSGRPLVV